MEIMNTDLDQLTAIRRIKLKVLIEELGGYGKAAQILGVGRATLSRLVNPGQLHSRVILTEEAREFEAKAHKPSCWLDQSIDQIADEPSLQPVKECDNNRITIDPTAGHIMIHFEEEISE